jgi:hypothetical protein
VLFGLKILINRKKLLVILTNSGALEIVRLNHEILTETEEVTKQDIPLYDRKIENNFTNFYENKKIKTIPKDSINRTLEYNDLSHLINNMKENRLDTPNNQKVKTNLEYTDVPYNTFPLALNKNMKKDEAKNNFSFAKVNSKFNAFQNNLIRSNEVKRRIGTGAIQ